VLHAEGFIKRTTGARIRSWKGDAFGRGLEQGSRGIAIIRYRYQATTGEETEG
jgi:hypothetical protein